MNSLERSIIFGDLSGFTALTEAHGDVDAVAIARRFKFLAEGALADDARVVKTMGDAVMITATDPVAAVQIAARLASSVHAEADFPMVRIGMHHGQVVLTDNDCFGATVNLAARVADHARAGQVLCTGAFAHTVTHLPNLTLRDAGVAHFKNIASDVRIFELWFSDSPIDAIVDPVCRMRVIDLNAASRIFFQGSPYYFCSTQCVKLFLEHPAQHIIDT